MKLKGKYFCVLDSDNEINISLDCIELKCIPERNLSFDLYKIIKLFNQYL